MDGSYYAMAIFGTIAVLFLAVQWLACSKAKRVPVKLIPVYLILVCGLFAIALWAGLFGTGSFGAHQILALILAAGIAFALVGDLTAWAIYAVGKRKR